MVEKHNRLESGLLYSNMEKCESTECAQVRGQGCYGHEALTKETTVLRGRGALRTALGRQLGSQTQNKRQMTGPDLFQMGRGTDGWRQGWGREWKKKTCCVPVPTLHKVCEHHELQTCTTTTKTEENEKEARSRYRRENTESLVVDKNAISHIIKPHSTCLIPDRRK